MVRSAAGCGFGATSWALLLGSLLAACAPRVEAPAPVVSRGTVERGPERVTVQRGDTLSDIAHAHHIPMRVLAEANGVPPPFRIQVGRTLMIPEAGQPRAPAPVSSQRCPQLSRAQQRWLRRGSITRRRPRRPRLRFRPRPCPRWSHLRGRPRVKPLRWLPTLRTSCLLRQHHLLLRLRHRARRNRPRLTPATLFRGQFVAAFSPLMVPRATVRITTASISARRGGRRWRQPTPASSPIPETSCTVTAI